MLHQDEGVNHERGRQGRRNRKTAQERGREILRLLVQGDSKMVAGFKDDQSDWGRPEGPMAHFFEEVILD
jgi:hypothetical protein